MKYRLLLTGLSVLSLGMVSSLRAADRLPLPERISGGLDSAEAEVLAIARTLSAQQKSRLETIAQNWHPQDQPAAKITP